jgi:phosphatidate cytidylyltransferase
VAGHGLFVLRDEQGTAAMLWLLGVVIVSDVMGYFAGRILGGPKFWPAISPKKTWSGTVAGWIGAAALGFGFAAFGYGSYWLVVLSPLVALAGQMGDIAESWLKRRVGAKDSSNLIPGHGGVLDRFDALTGAMVLVMILTRFVELPIGG